MKELYVIRVRHKAKKPSILPRITFFPFRMTTIVDKNEYFGQDGQPVNERFVDPNEAFDDLGSAGRMLVSSTSAAFELNTMTDEIAHGVQQQAHDVLQSLSTPLVRRLVELSKHGTYQITVESVASLYNQ